MATFSQSTIDKGSDMVQDFLCSTCEDKKLDTTADLYCESCMKFFCGKCINMHSQLFPQHAPFGRGDMKKWPVTKKVEDFLLKCDVHHDENLNVFCDDHNDLCCKNCAFLNHRQCQKVTLISDKVKIQSTDLQKDLQKLSVSIQTILEEMKKLQENQQAGIQYDQSSYDEQLHTIQETRREINAALDILEKKTLKEMKDTLAYLQASSKRDFDECIRLQDELKQLRDAIQDISDKSKLELSFIAMRKSEDKIQQSDTFLKKNTIRVKVSITFEPGSEIVQFLSKLSGLGRIKHRTQPLHRRIPMTNSFRYSPALNDKWRVAEWVARGYPTMQPLMVHKNPNKKFIKQAKSEQNMRISSDSSECKIRAICVLMDAQVLVVDDRNKKVKLLDQQYQVVSHMSVTTFPWEMCQITSHEVAMTLNDNGTRSNIHEVQFIAVRNRKLAEGKKLQLQHTCSGIACNQGDLYITADTALYKYTLSGKKISEIYKDTSGPLTVYKCAVSPTGDKLYITNNSQHKLLTLTREGTVLATFTDPALQDPLGVHATPTGQVLVCGYTSNTILQVDSEGRRKVATFATQEDGVLKPYSVFYNRHTSTLIVGLRVNSSILLFKGQ